MSKIPVSIFKTQKAKDLGLRLIYGKEFLDSHFIESFVVEKPGLAMTGFVKYIHAGRVQVLGKPEISYLIEKTDSEQFKLLESLCKKHIACFVITKNLKIPIKLKKVFQSVKVPLFKTYYDTDTTINKIQAFLESLLAPIDVIHGNLMDVFGVGTLIVGKSGIGKSECALELIHKGHRLIADDAVYVRLRNNFLIGYCSETLAYHLEVRGLGVINIKELFGISAVMLEKQINMVIKFIDWQTDKTHEQPVLDNETFELFHINLPQFILPVYPGRNMSVLVETAAKVYLLKNMGIDMVKEFDARLQKIIKKNRNKLLSSK